MASAKKTVREQSVLPAGLPVEKQVQLSLRVHSRRQGVSSQGEEVDGGRRTWPNHTKTVVTTHKQICSSTKAHLPLPF